MKILHTNKVISKGDVFELDLDGCIASCVAICQHDGAVGGSPSVWRFLRHDIPQVFFVRVIYSFSPNAKFLLNYYDVFGS